MRFWSRLDAGVRIVVEALLDNGKARSELSENLEEVSVVCAVAELTSHREKEGNLEMDLVGVDAVEDAIELCVGKSSI